MDGTKENETGSETGSTLMDTRGTNDHLFLEVRDLHAYYGRSHVLQGVDLVVNTGEVVSLLGRNGAGKTTTLRSIAGLIPKIRGGIHFDNRQLSHTPAYKIARNGIVYVPSGRRSFAQLSVKENLKVALDGRGAKGTQEEWDEVFRLFPPLKERIHAAAGVLSGGQNQMLKMACAFLARPKILLLDEPTEGLAPLVVKDLRERIADLAKTGVGILLAEQNSRFAFSLSRRAYILNKGVVQISGNVEDLVEDKEVLYHLGI